MTSVENTRLVLLGDVHWGAMPAERLEREFSEVVFPWLEANEFDALIQLGDWFDRRLSLDSDDAKVAGRVLMRLLQLCQARGVPLRLLKGTLSHDYDQLQNYRVLEADYTCFRVIGRAQHEELLPGFDVLWIPEEYPSDYSDYYSRFLFDEEGCGLVYDAIFLHGEVNVAANWSSMSESERHYGGTPCHDVEMLLQHSSGPVWAGHIHTRFRHKRRFGYPGSLSRWCHGEEAESKGFDVLDLEAKPEGGWEVAASVVENPLAPVYRTVNADEILSAADAPDQIVATLRAAAADTHRLRVKMGNFPIGVEELSVIRGALVDDHRVEVVAAARAVNEMAEVEIEEGSGPAEERVERLSYLRDPNLPGEERLLRYLHEKFPERLDVTIEEVRELTAPPAN